MRILVVDDHPMMAEALALAMRTLERATDVETVGDLRSAIDVAGENKFDLCLLDLGLPDCSGIDALARLREAVPALPVVVVSGADDAEHVLKALDRGAMGYIPKTSPRNVLLSAVRLVASGGIYVPTEALKPREPSGAAASDATATKTADDLGMSARQREVLDLLLKGLPNKLIARKLDISENTTKIHVSSVLRALGVTSRTQALIAASRLGLRLEA